ncbi:MAG: hypothetical protein ACRDZS_05245 [Acidimicrobiales bacterium]
MRPEATNWTRRTFLIRSGAVVLGGAACSSSDDGATDDEATDDDEQGDEMSADGVVNLSDVPTEETIFGWISEVFDQGIRRPGYPADEWAEGWIADQFRSIGLHNVRLEPITVTRWEPTDWSLEVIGPDSRTTTLDCFPVPFSAPVDGLETEVVVFDQASPGGVRDKASLFDVPLIRIPADLLATAGSAPADPTGRVVDPDGSLAGAQHIVPFGAQFQAVMEPSIEAGAAAFIGTLTDCSCSRAATCRVGPACVATSRPTGPSWPRWCSRSTSSTPPWSSPCGAVTSSPPESPCRGGSLRAATRRWNRRWPRPWKPSSWAGR